MHSNVRKMGPAKILVRNLHSFMIYLIIISARLFASLAADK